MISKKAKTMIMRTFATGRPLASFDEAVQLELVRSGYMKYSEKPLLVLTVDGRRYAQNQERVKSHV